MNEIRIQKFSDFFTYPESKQLKYADIARITRSSVQSVKFWATEQRIPNGSVLEALEGYIKCERLQEQIAKLNDYYR